MSTFTIRQDTITDLSTALNDKQDKNNALTTNTNQSISGHKSFTQQLPFEVVRDTNQQEVPSQNTAGQIGL